MTRDEALKEVAKFYRDQAHAVHKDDPYASHVTEADKERYLKEMLELADRIESGEHNSFTVEQLVHHKMTGESVPLLP